MNRAVWAAVAAFFTAQPAMPSAMAATPNLSGTYIINLNTLCQATQSVVYLPEGSSSDQDLQTFVNLPDFKPSGNPGKIEQVVGEISLTPTKRRAQSGTFTAAVTETDGSELITETTDVTGTSSSGDPMTVGSSTATGTYSLTATSLTLVGAQTQSYTAYFSRVSTTTGLARMVTLIGLDSNDSTCSDTGSLQHK